VRTLHLFAGAGGGILADLLLGHTTVCAVERDSYCRQVLLERQQEGTLPEFPIYDDIRTFESLSWHGRVDIVAGGFPCQPWSCAGKRLGTGDARYLWPEMARVIAAVRPSLVFAENVSLRAFEQPLDDLRRLGYRVPPALCLRARDVGAPHRRTRWWMLAADADRGRLEKLRQPLPPRIEGSPRNEPDRHREAGQGEVAARGRYAAAARAGWWTTEPDVGRVAHGVASRVDRLRALGNGQVPLCAASAFRILMQLHYS
jgi:DNA (cytosine-5)-methyltransferase 1